MTFFTVIVRGLIRRPVRTGLTLVGISIGIAAVVALVGMAWGYEKSIGKQLDVIGIDVVVSNMSGGLLPKVFDESLKDKVLMAGAPVMLLQASVTAVNWRRLGSSARATA